MIYIVKYLCKMQILILIGDLKMTRTTWETPAATELRFGFEVTLYVFNK